MNPLDILAEIINAGNAQGRSSGSGSSSKRPQIVRDILVGGPGQGSPAQERVQFPGVFREGRGSSSNNRPSANDIEDMLGVGRSNPGQSSQGTPSLAPTQRRVEAPSSRSGGSSSAPQGDIFGQEPSKPAAQESSASEREQVIVLIRAMIHAAKADGRIDAQEQQAILERVGNTNQETIQFLRQEFANATNARDFAWSVPLGMEAAVYAASIASITIDQQSEVDYLKELAHGLRLSPKVCNQIHQQYGIRPLF